MASLLGRPLRYANSLQVDVRLVDTAFQNAGIAASLRDALEQLDGPIANLAATRLALQTMWSDVLGDCTHGELIGLLRDNARLPVASLAKSLQVARGTVQNRLAKLERDGIIAGYTIRLRPKIDEQGIVALMTIAVEGNRIEPVLRTLRGDPAIVTLYTTNGRWDLVAEIRADTLQSFDQVLGRIRRVEGISGTETSLLLSTHKL